MREVALLTFDGPLIDSLREYWASEVVELSQATLPAGANRSPRGARTADDHRRDGILRRAGVLAMPALAASV